MAIQWGSAVSSGYAGVTIRIGCEMTYSPTTVTSGTSSVTVSWTFYVQVLGGYANGNDTWRTTGGDARTGMTSWNVPNNGGTDVIATGTKAVSLTYGSTKTFNLKGELEDVAPSANHAHFNANLTIPARPLTAPAAHTGVSASRVNDGQINVSWTRNATTAAPYTRQEVGRQEYTGNAWSTWSTINNNVSGTATSYADTTTVASRRYRYRTRAVNSAGASAWVSTGEVHTTPAAPTAAPTAVRSGTSTIVVTKPTLPGSATGWQVEHTPSPGTVTVSATIVASVDTFTHSPATSSVHKYRVRAVSSSPVLHGGWSPYSGTVQLLSAPNAPTNLSPNGEVRALATTSTYVTWSHNPTDSSEQTQYRLRRRIKGTTTWTTLAIQTSSTQGGYLTDLANGNEYEWEVQTRGEHADFGPWSATATLVTSALPVASVVSPSGGTVTMPSVDLGWSFYQASGRTQAGWQVELQKGEASGWVPVVDRTGSGSAIVWNTGNVLKNGGQYRWRVQVQDTSGQWSNWTAWATFSVAFVTPDAPEVTGSWDDDGFVLLTIAADPAGGTPPTESLTVERGDSADGPWTEIATDLVPGADWQDWSAPLDADLHYRVTAVSALPSTASTVIEVTTPPTGWLYLGGGPDFSQTVRLERRNTRSLTTGRERTVHLYEGAESPVEVSGAAVPLALAVSAVLTSTEQRLALQQVFSLTGPHLYRDGAQNAIVGTVSEMSASPDHRGEIEFSIERTWAGTWEQRQAAALAARGLTSISPVDEEG